MVVKALRSGDYSLEGYEDVLAIERKGGVGQTGDIARSVLEPRFHRELERLDAMPHAHVILEMTEEQLRAHPAGLPARVRARVRAKGPFIIKKIRELQESYPNVTWHYAGARGKEFAMAAMKAALREAA